MSEIVHGFVWGDDIDEFTHAQDRDDVAAVLLRTGPMFAGVVPAVLIPLTDTALRALADKLTDDLCEMNYGQALVSARLMTDALRTALAPKETPT